MLRRRRREAGACEDEIAELQATGDELRTQRDSLFRGETLRGLLLSSYAWRTIGRIATVVAFSGAAVMAALVVARLGSPAPLQDLTASSARPGGSTS
jgi:hypothetical protein